jgi:hypothetical protein
MDNNLRVLRRLHSVDELVDLRLKKPFTFDICDFRKDKGWLLDFIIQSVNEDMYYTYFSDLNDDEEEWHKIWNMISEYITIIHSKKIFDFYNRRCGK